MDKIAKTKRAMRLQEWSEKHEIVPLSPSPCALQTDNISCIKIIGNGITVELPENASAETITAILRGLR